MLLLRGAMELPVKTIVLKDGSRLTAAIAGDPSLRRTVFFLHGFPGSRREAAFGHGAAAARGISLAAFDRPGFGLSDFQKNRRLLDWPATLVEAAAALGVSGFSVIGVSGGGPYAAACAYANPPQLRGVAIVSGLGPLDDRAQLRRFSGLNRLLLACGRSFPRLSALPLGLLAAYWKRRPDRMLARFERILKGSDREFLCAPGLRRLIAEDFMEALRGGPRGAIHEFRILTSGWGFRPEDISRPVFLWHGQADAYVPCSVGREMAKRLPRCSASFPPGEGHCLIQRIIGEVLDAVSPQAEF